MMKSKCLIVMPLALVIVGTLIFVGATEGKDPNQVGTKMLQVGEQTYQGFSPIAIAITENGEYAYLSFDLSEYIFKMRLENLTVEAVADLSDYFPIHCQDIALDASEGKLFVYTPAWRKLIVLDIQDMSVIHTIDNIGGTMQAITQSQYGPRLITWDGGNTVKFVNTETYEVTKFIDDKMFFAMIQESRYDQSQWYVVSQTATGYDVGIYDYEAKAWNYSVPMHENEPMPCAHGFEVLPNEQKLYLATLGGWYPEYHAYGWLYSVDLVEKKVKVVPIDGGATCLEADPDNQRLYLGTGWPIPNTNNLLIVDTQSDNITGNIYLGQNKYGWPYTQMNDLQIDPAHPHLLYATSSDANAFIKVNLDNLTLIDMLVLNEESYQSHFFIKRPMQATGYVLISKSANALELDLNNATITNVVEFPKIRDDAYWYDIAIDNTGRVFIAQGETVLEVDAKDMHLIKTHPLPRDIAGLWSFVLSNDQRKLYSIWNDPKKGEHNPNTFHAIDTTNFQVKASVRLEGGLFIDKPYELPDSSKLYALGGQQNGPVVIQVIETNNYTIQKTITFDELSSLGITCGPNYPFAYDSSSHTLFVGATYVVLAIDTNTDTIKKVIYLKDVTEAMGLRSGQPPFTYINAVGLVYHPQENYLYIAHLDRSFISIYNLNNNQFLPQVIPLKGYFPSFMFASDDYSKMYTLNWRSDSISVIDVNSKVLEKVIDLHDYSWDRIPPLANAGADQTVDEDTIVTFDGSKSSDNVGMIGYTWTFTDLTLQTLLGATVTYNFTNPGTYVVTLNVTDAAGNFATDTIVITAKDVTPPIADAGSDRTVKLNTQVSFDASESSDNAGIVNYEWDFGDETTGTGKIATRTYKEPKTYTATLTVKDEAGNSNSDTITVTVEPLTFFEEYGIYIASLVVVAVIAIILLLYKRK